MAGEAPTPKKPPLRARRKTKRAEEYEQLPDECDVGQRASQRFAGNLLALPHCCCTTKCKIRSALHVQGSSPAEASSRERGCSQQQDNAHHWGRDCSRMHMRAPQRQLGRRLSRPQDLRWLSSLQAPPGQPWVPPRRPSRLPVSPEQLWVSPRRPSRLQAPPGQPWVGPRQLGTFRTPHQICKGCRQQQQLLLP